MAAHESTGGRKGGLGFFSMLGLAVLVAIGAVVVFRVVLAVAPKYKSPPSWAASSGVPTPRDFLYAMFPVDGAVPLCDGPDGKAVSTLDRAVTNSQEEITAGGWVQVNSPGGSLWVQLSKLEYLPPPNASVDYFAAFVAAYQARGPGKFQSASLDLHPNASGSTTVTLHLGQDDHWQEYVYEVSSGKATAREMYKVFGPGEALGDLGRVIMAFCAAFAFLLLVGLVSIVFRVRRRIVMRRESAANA